MPRADRPRRSRAVNIPALAGWLFADLLLVLFITVFASTTLPSAPPKPPSQHPTPHPTQSGTPRHQRVLVLNPYKFELSVPYPAIENGNFSSAAAKAVAAELEDYLKNNGLAHARAGLVEAFGWSPSAGGDGTKVATATNLAITKNLPLFSAAYTQSFWDYGQDGTVTVQVFFFAQQ